MSRCLVRDALVAAFAFALAIGLSWLIHLPWIFANVLVFGVPAALLLLLSPVARRRVSWPFAMLLAAFGVSTLGYFGELYGGGRSATSLPWRFAGGVVFEEVEWTVLFFAAILTVSQRFFATPLTAPTRRWAKVALIANFYVALAVVAIPALHTPFRDHVYIKAGLALEVPVIVMALAVDPAVWRELLQIGAVVTAGMLAFELLAIRNGYWVFDGQYVGMLSVLGYQFPVEELLFMIVLSGPAVVSSHALWKNWRVGVSR